jgi:hypothetical protein
MMDRQKIKVPADDVLTVEVKLEVRTQDGSYSTKPILVYESKRSCLPDEGELDILANDLTSEARNFVTGKSGSEIEWETEAEDPVF